MAATHQSRPHPQLQQFITAGEAELASLEEPARTIRAQSLFAELQRRFTPEAPVEIAEFTEAPTDKDVEDVVIQDQQDREENERTHADDEEGDGESSDHFRSHLQVKCMDNATAHPVVIYRGPDVQVIGPIAAKPDDVQLVGEGQIRDEERGYLDYKPTRPYQDRVAKWMWRLRDKARPKRGLVCQFCGADFEGKKGQKYCSTDCSKHRAPRSVKETHDPGKCNCDTCDRVYDIFSTIRYEYLLQKYRLQPGEEFQSDMMLTEAEKRQLMKLAVRMAGKNDQESTDEQQ